jgi:predicted PurR-regulated permease PerM
MPNIQISDGVSVLIKYRWKIVLAFIILIIAALFFYVIFPLLDGLVMGLVLAYVARPLKNFLDRFSPKLSPYLATATIVLPIFFITGLGIIEIFNQLLWVIKNQDLVVNTLVSIVEKFNLPDFASNKIKDIILNFTSYMMPIIQQLPVTEIAKSFVMFILNTIIAVFLCFFLLVDGGRLIEKIIDIIPQEEEEFYRKFMLHYDSILSSMFVANAYSAIAVGVLSLIVFSAFGIPHVLALSALMIIAAIVPIFAGYMVIVPIAIYRYFQYGSENAIIFLIVCLVFVIIPPELIRPLLIQKSSDIHLMLIIIAFLGGGLVGGIAGFFIAPILLGAIMAAYRAYVDVQRKEILKPQAEI